jgi:hypothetical protein
MHKLGKVIFFLGCIALFSIPAGVSGQTGQEPDGFIEQVLKTVGELKIGDTRAKLERDFTPDGGLQFGGTERYVYRKCPLIKIDVEFSRKKGSTWPNLSPEDTLTSISKPYLEYPFYD